MSGRQSDSRHSPFSKNDKNSEGNEEQAAVDRFKEGTGELNNPQVFQILNRDLADRIRGKNGVLGAGSPASNKSEEVANAPFSKDKTLPDLPTTRDDDKSTLDQLDANPQQLHLFDDQRMMSTLQELAKARQDTDHTTAKRLKDYDQKFNQLLTNKVEVGIKIIGQAAKEKDSQSNPWHWTDWQNLEHIPNLAHERKEMKRQKKRERIKQGTFKMDDKQFLDVIIRGRGEYRSLIDTEIDNALRQSLAGSPQQTKLQELKILLEKIYRVSCDEATSLDKILKDSSPIDTNHIDESFKKLGVHLYIFGRIHRQLYSILGRQDFPNDALETPMRHSMDHWKKDVSQRLADRRHRR